MVKIEEKPGTRIHHYNHASFLVLYIFRGIPTARKFPEKTKTRPPCFFRGKMNYLKICVNAPKMSQFWIMLQKKNHPTVRRVKTSKYFFYQNVLSVQ